MVTLLLLTLFLLNMLSSCVSQYADEHYDHDNIFHSMLGLLHVDSKSYDYQQDIFSACHTGSDIRLSSVPAILSPSTSTSTSTSAIDNVLN